MVQLASIAALAVALGHARRGAGSDRPADDGRFGPPGPRRDRVRLGRLLCRASTAGTSSPANGPQYGAGLNLGFSRTFDFVLVGGEVAIHALGNDIVASSYLQAVGRGGVLVTDNVLLFGAAGLGTEPGPGDRQPCSCRRGTRVGRDRLRFAARPVPPRLPRDQRQPDRAGHLRRRVPLLTAAPKTLWFTDS